MSRNCFQPSSALLTLTRADVCARIVAGGGFPEAVGRTAGERRNAWFRSYIAAILQRDVRDLANIEKLTDLPRLLGLPSSTVKRVSD